MRILACDSGVERTGYAIFDTSKKDNTLLVFDCIFTKRAAQLSERLRDLQLQLQQLLKKYTPEIIVMEKLYFQNNQKTAIMVAQAQGVLLALAGAHNLEAVFLSPTEIKHIVTGYGKSDKKSVQKMLKLLLGITIDPKSDDVADAIACGYAYCTINRLI